MPDPTPIFTPAALSKSVHDTLDQAMVAIPPGQDGAILIDGTVTSAGRPAAHVLIATRIGDHWQLAAGAGWDGHAVEGKVAMMGSWKWR
jgi:hypothetical protein